MVNGLIIYPSIMSDLVPDVLATLVKLSEPDRPSGIQAEVLRAVQNMVVLLDEQFLVHSAVHRAVLRLLRNCVGDDIQEQLDGRNKVMGAAKGAVRSQPSEYEEDRESIQSLKCQLTDLSYNSGQLTVYPLQPYTNIPGVAYDIFP
jgi:hypothetical protein